MTSILRVLKVNKLRSLWKDFSFSVCRVGDFGEQASTIQDREDDCWHSVDVLLRVARGPISGRAPLDRLGMASESSPVLTGIRAAVRTMAVDVGDEVGKLEVAEYAEEVVQHKGPGLQPEDQAYGRPVNGVHGLVVLAREYSWHKTDNKIIKSISPGRKRLSGRSSTHVCPDGGLACLVDVERLGGPSQFSHQVGMRSHFSKSHPHGLLFAAEDLQRLDLLHGS